MAKKNALTLEGQNKLIEELTQLKAVTRKEVAERLKTARGYGDLSENSEYDEAKNEQAKVEARIAELESILSNVTIINRGDSGGSHVDLGSHVRVLDIEYNEELDLHIVGSSESDPDNNYISDESPIGAALMGGKPGDTVEAHAPGGAVALKILEILDN